MTPEQAKGYCNLRHHDALGEWPAQHAARERGKSVALVEADPLEAWARVQAALKAAGSEEARVQAGVETGGQFTAGSDGPAKKQPNPFARGKKPGWAAGPGGRRRGSKPGKPAPKRPAGPGKRPTGHKPDPGKAHAEHVAHLRHEITQLTKELGSLEQEKHRLSTTGVSNFGTSSTVKPHKPSTPSSSTTTASTASSATGSSSSSRAKPAAKPSATSPRLAAVNAKIASVKAQLASVRQQLQTATSKGKSAEPDLTKDGPHRYRHGWIKLDGVDTSPSTIGNGDRVRVSSPERGDFEGHVVGSVSGPMRTDGPISSTTTTGHYVAREGTDTRTTPPVKVGREHITHRFQPPPDGERLANQLASNPRPRGAVGEMSDPQLAAADQELSRRAAALGKPGQLARHHRAVKDEIARRGGSVKSVRNPRDMPSGRFRTFQGEISEARQALSEGRVADVVELLGSARALAQTDQERLVLGSLQAAIGRVQHTTPVLTKSHYPGSTGQVIEKYHYKHGWIKIGDEGAPEVKTGTLVRGEHPERGHFEGQVIPGNKDDPAGSVRIVHTRAGLGSDHVMPEHVTHAYSNGPEEGWVRHGPGGEKDYTTDPMPDLLQQGAINYRKMPDGNYRMYDNGTGKPMSAGRGGGGGADRIAPTFLRRQSRESDSPLREISSHKQPRLD